MSQEPISVEPRAEFEQFVTHYVLRHTIVMIGDFVTKLKLKTSEPIKCHL